MLFWLVFVFLIPHEVLALEWPWKKKEDRAAGFTSGQVQERTEVGQSQIKHKMLAGQEETIVYSGMESTYADLYDEKGVATRINLDRNGDGKVRWDDFLLATAAKIETKITPPKSTLTNSFGFKEDAFWQELYLGKIQEESASLLKQINWVRQEIAQIDENVLPAITKNQNELMNEFLGLQEKISDAERELTHFGFEMVKEDAEQEIQLPENYSHSSTVQRLLRERRQLLIQTAKVKELIKTQELYRSQQTQEKLELENRKAQLQLELTHLEEEENKIRGVIE